LFERNVAIAEWRECRIARPPTDKEGDTPKFSFTSLDLSKNQKNLPNTLKVSNQFYVKIL